MTYTNSAYTCDFCQSKGNGSRFRCSICDFDLHEDCVAYPPSIFTPLHSEHSLFLALNQSNSFSCDSCNKSAKGYTYSCRCCNFDLHPSCTGFLQMKSQLSSTDGMAQNLAGLSLGSNSRSTANPTAGNFTGAMYGTGFSIPSNTSSHLGSVPGAVSNIPNYGQGNLIGSTYSYPFSSFTGGLAFAFIRPVMTEVGHAVGKKTVQALFSENSRVNDSSTNSRIDNSSANSHVDDSFANSYVDDSSAGDYFDF